MLPADAHRWYTGGEALAAAGVTHRPLKHALTANLDRTARRACLDPADVAALRSIGIDIDEIVTQAERVFGPGALAARRGDRRPRAASDAKRWRIANAG